MGNRTARATNRQRVARRRPPDRDHADGVGNRGGDRIRLNVVEKHGAGRGDCRQNSGRVVDGGGALIRIEPDAAGQGVPIQYARYCAVWPTVTEIGPVMVNPLGAGVGSPVVTLRVVDPEVFTELGLNEAVAPEGSPATVKPTVPVKPLSGVTVAAYVVLPPGRMLREPGVAETPKSDTVTVRVAAVLGAPASSVTVSDATNVPGLE